MVEPRSTHLLRAFQAVRFRTRELCEPLEPDDYVVQSMTDASPTKWHLAHTTWFFENFVLAAHDPDYTPFDPSFGYLFNSYYDSVGERHARPERGVLSRPPLEHVLRFRDAIEDRVATLLDSGALSPRLEQFVEIGLHHEQQHQELLLTDLKHAFSRNVLRPVYREGVAAPSGRHVPALGWIGFEDGVYAVGRERDESGFAFDNESPRHRVFLEPFEISDRVITNREFIEFIDDGGYDRSELWLADGWDQSQREGWRAPLYWERDASGWRHFTLGGMQPVDPAAPVTHVSLYEADAFATWRGGRLPTEFEWEAAVADRPVRGNFIETDRYAPSPAGAIDGPREQFFGDGWEWTQSSYSPYPGYRREAGPLGEYNGKFMCNQYVLRGGSCVSPQSHLRSTYRNFFYPGSRWQFATIRLVRSLDPKA